MNAGVGATGIENGSLRAARAGETRLPEPSFEEFYASAYHLLTLQLCAYTGDLLEAQDVAQEALCRALARWKKVAAYDDPLGWTRRVAWNLAASRWRRRRTARAYLARQRETYLDGPSPDRVALAQAMSTLPDQHRRVLALFYLADVPIAEIAAQLGVAEGTVKSNLHRARTALAARLIEIKEGDRRV